MVLNHSKGKTYVNKPKLIIGFRINFGKAFAY